MERLGFGAESRYDGLETAIHLARYAVVRKLCVGKSVLDLACGEGYGSRLMMDWGADEVVGIDVSSEAIGRARELFQMDKLDYRVADAEHLVELFSDKRFDLIVSLETVEHVEKPEKLLSDFKKLLTPSGVLVVSCPNDWWYYPSEQEANPHHVRKYTFAQFQEMAEDVLGAPRAWYLGGPQAGFINMRVDGIQEADSNSTQSLMLTAVSVENAMVVPSEQAMGPTEAAASYFVGIWSASPDLSLPLALGATSTPSSMDAFSNGFFQQAVDEARRLRVELQQANERLERVGIEGTSQSGAMAQVQQSESATDRTELKPGLGESITQDDREAFDPGLADAPQAREQAILIEKDLVARRLAELTHREMHHAQQQTRLQRKLMAATLDARRAKATEALSNQQMLEQQGRVAELLRQHQELMRQVETMSFEALRYRRIRDALPEGVRRVGMKALRAAQKVVRK